MKRRGDPIAILSPGPVAVILAGVAIAAVIYAWGQGENLFSLYLDGYRLIFGYGT